MKEFIIYFYLLMIKQLISSIIECEKALENIRIELN